MSERHAFFTCMACNRTMPAAEALNHAARCRGVHVLRPVKAEDGTDT